MRLAVFHELPKGGARNAVIQFAKQLKKRNTVDLYYIDEQKASEEEKHFTSVHFFKFIPKPWSGGDWKVRLYKDTAELYQNYRLHKLIADTIQRFPYDAVLINASKVIESPFLLRFPLPTKIFYCHDPYYRLVYEPQVTFPKNLSSSRFLYEKLNRSLRKKLDRKNIHAVDYCFANSSFAAKLFSSVYGLPCGVSYYGVDTTFYTPGVGKKKIDILFIGSKDSLDGYDTLLEIQTRLPKNIVVRTVLFEDEWLSQKEIRNLYQQSKIVLSLARQEPFGLVPLEAMACGTSVVAVREGGYPESVVNNKTGFLISRDAAKAAEKITYLLENDEVREGMGEKGRENMLSKWTWEKAALLLENNIKGCVQKV